MTDDRRVVIAGNNAAAVDVLDLLLQALAAEAILALTPPQRPDATWQSSLAGAAEARGVAWIAPDDVNDEDTVRRVREHRPTLLLSVYYTQLFRQELLGAVDGPTVNFHPSLLPRHRGHAPIIWAIAEGDTVTGLSVHHVDTGVDTGRLIYRRSIPIHPLDTGYDVHGKMALLVRATAADLLRGWLAGEELPRGEEQMGVAMIHRRSDPQLNHIDWSQGRDRIRNVVRALAPPLPGAFVRHDGDEIVLVQVEPAEASPSRGRALGMVENDGEGMPVVTAADGALRIRTVMKDGVAVPGRELRLPNGTILR